MNDPPKASDNRDRRAGFPRPYRTPLTWLRQNLFNTWYNSILTVACLFLIYRGLGGLLVWFTTKAEWEVVQVNLRLLLVGRYPEDQYWRIWTILAIIVLFAGLSWVRECRKWIAFAWILAFPAILWLIGGGLGLRTVETSLWNGLLLTLLTAVVSIAFSFPIGVLLALGRQSDLPVLRWFCIFYIEVIRGLPLIGILFMAKLMLPLVLPPEMRLDQVFRAIAGLTLFSAAYVAENVRGGLQSIPRGQIEAAWSLGFNTPLVLLLIVLPQALRAVIPAIVGQFIGLFKDTTLLGIVGLSELLGMARSILAQPEFLGRYAEVYVFIGLFYWTCCYAMSLASRRLERHHSASKR